MLKGNPIRIEEFEAERAWWGSKADGFSTCVEDEPAWPVSSAATQFGKYDTPTLVPVTWTTEIRIPKLRLCRQPTSRGLRRRPARITTAH